MTFVNPFSKNNHPKIEIIIDNRERNSKIPSILEKRGFDIRYEQLEVGDYLVGETIIERKTVQDFHSSIINKRLIQQTSEILQHPKSFLIIEGILDTDIYSGPLHENAIRGFILSLVTERRLPIIYSYSAKDTAKYLELLANKKIKNSSLRPNKISFTNNERLQFILEGFPGIGPINARKLLEKFGSINNIFKATEMELTEIIGKKGAGLYHLINLQYL